MTGSRTVVTTLSLLVALACAGCPAQDLAIQRVEPGSGVVAGNEPIKVHGTGFRQGMGIEVFFGNEKAPAVVVQGTDMLLVTTPPAERVGLVDVRVQTDRGEGLILRNAFRYVENQNFNLTDAFGGTRSKSGR